jgi:predicted SAM-dependent methyltransferase
MKLYVGSHHYRPDGYKTVDIDEAHRPDILADITQRIPVESEMCEEAVASHVLEHIEWPDSYAALAELGRVLRVGGRLKLSLPDMGMLSSMVLRGTSDFHAMALIFGVGGRTNKFEAHRFGYTAGMLTDMLTSLGFGEFDWWKWDVHDASNGWAPRPMGHHMAISLNVAATKMTAPAADPKLIHASLIETPMDDFLDVVARVVGREVPRPAPAWPALAQQIHFQLIEARRRIHDLEDQMPRWRFMRSILLRGRQAIAQHRR